MKLPLSVTMEEAAAVHRQVQAAVEQHKGTGGFGVDASELASFDTSALAVLLAAHRAARAKGQLFAVQRAPAKLSQLAALYGVSELLGLQASAI